MNCTSQEKEIGDNKMHEAFKIFTSFISSFSMHLWIILLCRYWNLDFMNQFYILSYFSHYCDRITNTYKFKQNRFISAQCVEVQSTVGWLPLCTSKLILLNCHYNYLPLALPNTHHWYKMKKEEVVTLRQQFSWSFVSVVCFTF